MTTRALTPARIALIAASILAELSSSVAGQLPGLVLLLAAAATVYAGTRQVHPDSWYPKAARLTGAAVGLGASIHVATVVTTRDASPLTGLRWLAGSLIVLSLLLAPMVQDTRGHRLWAGMAAGVLVASCAGRPGTVGTGLIVATTVALMITALALQQQYLAETAATPLTAPATVRTDNPLSPNRWLAPVSAAVVCGTLVFVALPGHLGGDGLARSLVHRLHHSSDTFSATRAQVGVDTRGSGVLDLRTRGTLPTTPLVDVPLHSPPLWRGTVYRTYTGGDWLANGTASLGIVRGRGTVAVPPSSDDPVPPGRARDDRLTIVPGTNSLLLWAPGVPTRVSGQIDGVLRTPGAVRLLADGQLSGYTVRATQASTSTAALRRTPATAVASVWTALPAELPSRVRTLASQVTAGADTRLEQVDDVERYLREHEKYSLDEPVPPVDVDAVNQFLFHDHIGFCEQFASAAAVMLRAVGVPTRVVSGLAYGTPHGDQRVVTAADAHAWIEVDYPGVGWSPSDPTAGAALVDVTTSQSWPQRLWNDLSGGLSAIATIVLALAVVAAMALLIAALRRRERGRRGRGVGASSSPEGTPGPVLNAFREYEARAPDRRPPAATAREYIDGVGDAELTSAVAVLERECYGATAPDEATTDAAVRAFSDARSRPPD